MSWRVSDKAAEDIDALIGYGVGHYSRAQISAYVAGLFEQFGTLARFPELGPARVEIGPDARSWGYKAHIILYSVDVEDCVVIRRVLHAASDWRSGDFGDGD